MRAPLLFARGRNIDADQAAVANAPYPVGERQ
jgi:hypothetical protein